MCEFNLCASGDVQQTVHMHSIHNAVSFFLKYIMFFQSHKDIDEHKNYLQTKQNTFNKAGRKNSLKWKKYSRRR